MSTINKFARIFQSVTVKAVVMGVPTTVTAPITSQADAKRSSTYKTVVNAEELKVGGTADKDTPDQSKFKGVCSGEYIKEFLTMSSEDDATDTGKGKGKGNRGGIDPALTNGNGSAK